MLKLGESMHRMRHVTALSTNEVAEWGLRGVSEPMYASEAIRTVNGYTESHECYGKLDWSCLVNDMRS